MLQSKIKNRITYITKKYNLSHYGSSLGVAEVLQEIDKVKRPEDLIVLDEAHGALGYYVWLESHGLGDAETRFERHGVHQSKDEDIKVSGGSLSLAGTVGLGMAMVGKTVYCITSDGALAEGIWWEILRIKADENVDNFKVYVNANGWSAYDPVDVDRLEERVHAFCPDVVFVRTKVNGLEDHYRKL